MDWQMDLSKPHVLLQFGHPSTLIAPPTTVLFATTLKINHSRVEFDRRYVLNYPFLTLPFSVV